MVKGNNGRHGLPFLQTSGTSHKTEEMVLMKPLKHCIKNSHGLSINKTTEANSPVGDTANRTQTAFHPISIEQWPMTKEKLQAVGQLYMSSCRLNI